MPQAIGLEVEQLIHRANKGDWLASRQLLLLDHLLHPAAERIRTKERAVNERVESFTRRVSR